MVGVGITPNTELAELAGLAVDNEIVVGEHMRSADPDVLAAGDVSWPCQACFSSWPPKPLRMAERTWSAKSSSPREAKRE